jgi:PEP-CTERM motif
MRSLAKRRWIHWTAATLFLALGATAEARADHVAYATADNGTTFLFGTMDLTTGQFTQITTTTPLFGSITAGAGGTLYGGEGNLNFNLDTISSSGVTSQFGSVTAPSNSFGFTGLASAGAAGFYAIYQTGSLPGPFSATLEHISANGNSSSVVGTLSTSFWSFNSGNLAFGPNGNLYFNVWPTPSDVATLYQVNTTTGAATAVGSGLGTTDPLALVSVGSTLYGIDTFIPSTPSIFTINTTTGAATEVGTVSGLPTGYTLDTMGGSVPEPATITLLGTGALVLLVFSRHVRRSSSRG